MSTTITTVHCTRIDLLKYSRQVEDKAGAQRRWEHVSLQPLVCCVSIGLNSSHVACEQQLIIEWSPGTRAHMPVMAPVRLVRKAF